MFLKTQKVFNDGQVWKTVHAEVPVVWPMRHALGAPPWKEVLRGEVTGT